MTRIYVPTSLAGLMLAQEKGVLQAPGGPVEGPVSGPLKGPENGPDDVLAHAVTAAVREWYVEGSVEELEFSTLMDAAEASLAVLAREPEVPRRRVVVAADVPDGSVTPSGFARSAVLIKGPVSLSAGVSVHVDEVQSEPVIAAAVAALPAAAAGDEDARFLLDEAEACDLLWYDVSEIDDLIG
jgi:hypothetical protein